MVVEARRLPYESLTRAAHRLALGPDLGEALELIAAAAVEATGADLAVVRTLEPERRAMVARAAAPATSPLGAEVLGSHAPAAEADGGSAATTLRIARCTQAAGVLVVPAWVGSRLGGVLELVRSAEDFAEDARSSAELAGAHLALTLRQLLELDDGTRPGVVEPVTRALDWTGEALAAGADFPRAAQHVVRVAAQATGATSVVIWRLGADGLEAVAVQGAVGEGTRELARRVLETWQPSTVEQVRAAGADAACVVSIKLGQPPFGVLQLLYKAAPPAAELEALASFGARAAHTLRAGEHALELELELERTRALLSVVGEAISRLSLAHTLETAVERTADLLSIDRVGIYLREEGQLRAAAGRGLFAGLEETVWALHDLLVGPLRARRLVDVRLGEGDPVPSPLERALRSVDLDAALAVPLRVHDETIGLLVGFPGARRVDESERVLLASLATQLAVVVQNARLHEREKELRDTLEAALSSERDAAKRLAALYEISRSSGPAMSLAATLQAVARTIVEVLGVDAAVVRVPDERGEMLVARGIHVADEERARPLRAILRRPQRRLPRRSRPRLLTAAAAARLGGGYGLLAPFLEKGSSAAVVPIDSAKELLGVLMVLSLDPVRPISEETVSIAETMAAQAALAIDNARLYEQQRTFTETIQRALLPVDRPRVPGLEVGAVYESAARAAVGGDVYDFVELADGRLAVVLGDVTGHGIDATADMAMVKFVFRSLVREHSEPADFLAHANEVIADELAAGRFVTMTYLAIDGTGSAACASAGHPPPRVVYPDGRVEPLRARGLALGIDVEQRYEAVEARIPSGAAVVLYTDGVVEARAGGDLYGLDRLDELLSARRDLAVQELAQAVLDGCRTFAGGGPADDCAVVVVRVT